MNLSAVISGFLTTASLIMAIGAQNAFILRQGLQQNFVGLIIIICSLSDILLISSGIAGIGKIVQTCPQLLQFFRYGGALFLAAYGLMAAKRALSTVETLNPTKEKTASRNKIILTCLAFTFLNPHVYLDTMILIGSISTRFVGIGKWFFGMGACMASVTWFTLLGYGAKFLQPFFQNPLTWKLLEGFIALLMFFLSYMLIFHSTN